MVVSNENILSKEGVLYKMSDFSFDIIHLVEGHNQVLDYLIKLYPESKIYSEKSIWVDLFEDYKNVINPTNLDKEFDYGVTFIVPTLNRPSLIDTINSIKN